jgi:hypothetical protein
MKASVTDRNGKKFPLLQSGTTAFVTTSMIVNTSAIIARYHVYHCRHHLEYQYDHEIMRQPIQSANILITRESQ